MSKGRPDQRQKCTAKRPAPVGKHGQWDYNWRHPDAKGRCINEDHDDWRYHCPHCDCFWIYEGPDA